MDKNQPQSSFGQRMSDIGGLKITRAADLAEPKIPEGWRSRDSKAHKEGQHDKSEMLDAEMNPDDNADMSDNEYEYWNTISTGDPVTQGEIDAAEGDGKKYTHTYKDSKTGNTRKVRYGAKGYKIAPGTKRGDSYCARSEGDRKSEGYDCSGKDKNTPLCLSRKKWKCTGTKSEK